MSKICRFLLLKWKNYSLLCQYYFCIKEYYLVLLKSSDWNYKPIKHLKWFYFVCPWFAILWKTKTRDRFKELLLHCVKLKRQVKEAFSEVRRITLTLTHIARMCFKAADLWNSALRWHSRPTSIIWSSNTLRDLGDGCKLFVDSLLTEDICCSQYLVCFFNSPKLK